MNADPDGAPTPAADEWLSRRSQEAEQAVGAAFDLSACVREPIHLLGGVQSYGTLLAAEVASGTVVTAADNTARLLGVEARELVGGPVLRVLGAPDWEEAVALSAEGEGAVLSLPVTAGAGPSPRAFDLSVHRRDGLLVLEFEPGEADPAASRDFYQGVRRALGRLRSAASVAECCATAVREMRALTGFERVVAYRFDGADGPGEVVAESAADGWEPWLGLWFPATDIPPQARRLYEENWIRVIGDVDDATARLVPERRADTGGVLDLSRAGLRTVSGFHLEYLRNIGVRSSMSVSVLRDGRLWGLIACHGADPKRLGPEVRSACELFGTAFSLHLTALEERDRADSLVGVGGRAASVARLLGTDVYDSLLRHEAEVRELAGADGLVVARDGQVRTTGPAVGARLAGELKRLAAGLAPGQVWATDRLAETLEAGGGDASAAEGGPSGVLLIALERGRSYLAWTRAERPEPRRWAADPDRPVRVGPRGERLTPRGSGAVFRSVTRGRSLPWQAREEHTAVELWRLLTGMVLRHADELSALNEELRVINADLDSFAHAAAHDLKEPLRGISHAAEFLVEDAGAGLDATSVRRLGTMRRLAGRMDDLLNSLLHYSRMGRGGLRRTRVGLDRALDDALEVAGPRLADAGVRVLRPDRLPAVDADPDRLDDVLVNLLVNAAKYAADRPDRTVRVGVEEVAPGPGGGLAVVVRDNGIGIPPERQEEVFGLFKRLHGPAEHSGGTGVGLAVVRRIVERHGGRVWLTSTPGEGTAFYFTLGEPGAAGG
ncbi:ATP-binding protein [Streptomyces albidoflavus]|uniref:ATP-binding protein n=1 Tax=Streptomyces albidoflavus TaxID=1886 RepID=UPI00340C4391